MEHEAPPPASLALQTVHGQLCAYPWPVVSPALGTAPLTKAGFTDQCSRGQAQATKSPLWLPSAQSAHQSPGKLGRALLLGHAGTSPGGPCSHGDGWRHRWQHPLLHDHQTLQNKLAPLGPVNRNTLRKQIRQKQSKELIGLS